ncbi:MAG: ATP-binding protein, partial [Fibrobacterales bacterium]
MSDAKIKKSGERYQFVATQPKQMIYDYNLKTKDFNWSGDIEGVTGYPKEQFQSISLDKWKLLIHLEDREDAVENFEKSIVEGGNYLSGYRLMHFTGGYRHLEVTGSFVLNNKNERIQMLGIVRDITERIEVEEEKVRLVEQLSHRNKMDAIGQLAGGIAHDFNNMLSGIMGAASLLGNPKYNLPEKCLDWVKLIQTSSERAADLTAKLLAFGRKSKLTSTPVNLHAILDDTVSLLESTIDKAIEITILKEANDFVTAGDDSDLQNAFLNICINASHAMKAGGEITIITRNIYLDNAFKELRNFDLTQGKYVEIEFRDTGCGIPVENKDKIFDPFYTTKENGEGSGLGLAAVYGTIQEHHGAIFVDSEVGVGTVFHIVLPFVKEYKRIAQRDGALVKG